MKPASALKNLPLLYRSAWSLEFAKDAKVAIVTLTNKKISIIVQTDISVRFSIPMMQNERDQQCQKREQQRARKEQLIRSWRVVVARS
jgi:hypothetical protein